MSYDKQTWYDYPSIKTPITAARLNHIEEGIKEVETNSNQIDDSSNDLDRTYSSNKINEMFDDFICDNNAIYIDPGTDPDSTNDDVPYYYDDKVYSARKVESLFDSRVFINISGSHIGTLLSNLGNGDTTQSTIKSYDKGKDTYFIGFTDKTPQSLYVYNFVTQTKAIGNDWVAIPNMSAFRRETHVNNYFKHPFSMYDAKSIFLYSSGPNASKEGVQIRLRDFYDEKFDIRYKYRDDDVSVKDTILSIKESVPKDETSNEKLVFVFVGSSQNAINDVEKKVTKNDNSLSDDDFVSIYAFCYNRLTYETEPGYFWKSSTDISARQIGINFELKNFASDINDEKATSTSTYSSDKIERLIANFSINEETDIVEPLLFKTSNRTYTKYQFTYFARECTDDSGTNEILRAIRNGNTITSSDMNLNNIYAWYYSYGENRNEILPPEITKDYELFKIGFEDNEYFTEDLDPSFLDFDISFAPKVTNIPEWYEEEKAKVCIPFKKRAYIGDYTISAPGMSFNGVVLNNMYLYIVTMLYTNGFCYYHAFVIDDEEKMNIGVLGNASNNYNDSKDLTLYFRLKAPTSPSKCDQTEDGTYILKATVNNGEISYEWVREDS